MMPFALEEFTYCAVSMYLKQWGESPPTCVHILLSVYVEPGCRWMDCIEAPPWSQAVAESGKKEKRAARNGSTTSSGNVIPHGVTLLKYTCQAQDRNREHTGFQTVLLITSEKREKPAVWDRLEFRFDNPTTKIEAVTDRSLLRKENIFYLNSFWP